MANNNGLCPSSAPGKAPAHPQSLPVFLSSAKTMFGFEHGFPTRDYGQKRNAASTTAKVAGSNFWQRSSSFTASS